MVVFADQSWKREKRMDFVKCKCCDCEVYVKTGEDKEFCHLCETRQEKCLHNISERSRAASQPKTVCFHYSILHEEIGGEPESCQYCLSRLI